MRAIIDRFEGDMAVCEQDDHTMIHIRRGSLPPAAQEGDVLLLGEKITLDLQETQKRREHIKQLTQDLWE